MGFRANFHAFRPSGRWPLALLRQAEIGNLHENPCGSHFANSKDPSRTAKITQLQPQNFFEKNLSNLLHHPGACPWILCEVCSNSLQRENESLQIPADFSSPIGAGNSADFAPEWREAFLQNLRCVRHGVGSGGVGWGTNTRRPPEWAGVGWWLAAVPAVWPFWRYLGAAMAGRG